MGSDDNPIKLRLMVPGSDSYIANSEDYADDIGHQALLHNLAETVQEEELHQSRNQRLAPICGD